MRIFKLAITVLLAGAQAATAGILILNLEWVKKVRNRATIEASFIVDRAHKKANSGAKDGDMHVAGRAKEVGLPMVAEIMNAGAADGKAIVALIHAGEGKSSSTPMTGVWRLWFEHPGARQVQFATVAKAENTNPDHSFEIHPVTQFGPHNVAASFRAIPGFDAKDAKTAFETYEKQQVLIKATKTAVTLDAKKVGFNYVGFRMRLIGAPKALEDGGRVVLADVFPLKGGDEDALATKIRMVFTKDTPPWKLLAGASEGDEFDVLGIPRVDLVMIHSFASKAGTTGVRRKLPYEMIIVDAKPAP
jgi:hypothetical protein